MQTVSTTCTAPAGLETTLLQVAAALVGAVEDVEIKTASDGCQLKSTVAHSFSGVTQDISCTSLTGVIRFFLSAANPLAQLGGDTATQQAATESWIQAAEQTLLPVVRKGEKQDIFSAAVENFCENVNQYLTKGAEKQTWLVGTHATMADAIVATALAACILTVCPDAKIPESVSSWCQKTLDLLVSSCSNKNLAQQLSAYLSAFKAGGDAAAAATPAAAGAAVDLKPATAEETADNAVIQALKDLGISDFQAYTHPTCDTAEALVKGVPLPDPTHTHTKNLFFKDKKHGMFLVTVRPTAAVNTKALGQLLKLPGKTNLRLADAKILLEQLKVKPGCVGPLAVLQKGIAVRTTETAEDDKTAITVVLDQELVGKGSGKFTTIHSHPLRNDMSVPLAPAQLLEALSKIKVEPVVLEFAEADPDAAGKAPATRPPATKEAPQSKKQGGGGKKKQQQQPKQGGKKGETLLALQCTKSEDFAKWYTDVIVLSEMISYYDVSGCYILRPWSYKIWELVQDWFNERIQNDMGVENAYFPMFVSKDRLETEKDHVEGFAPEVAWVTKSGSGDLAKPIAVRPTSETIMYPAYSDWIQSHRDLPLKLNQWSNVVRWEFKYPTPFLRTREFLWQEGHTAHTTCAEADETVMQALDLYRRVYEELMAVPVVPGYKTEKEKFAGGYRTTTVEAYIAGSGRAIQGATSHNLGQNFGKMFDITFQNDKGESELVWQTSWGLTTRTIGVMVMVHGDDKGLVLPPRVAPLQVVIVPIVKKDFTTEQAAPYCTSIFNDLKAAGIRVKYDDRDLYNPGWKYNHWEQKGVPIRIEVGPRDVEKKSARVVIRHSGAKEDHPVEGMGELLKTKLDEIQKDMFEKAKQARDTHLVQVTEWKDFVPNLEKNNLVLTPWCGGEHQDWEEWVKNKSREESLKARGEEEEDDKTATSVAAKTLCIPFDQPELPAGTKCLASGLDATCWVLWGRSY